LETKNAAGLDMFVKNYFFSILGDFIVTTVGHENEEPTKVDGFQVNFAENKKS